MDKEMEIKICEKLNQLTPGQEFKSFKALCDFFEIQASGGNKRIAQKKLIEKYCRLRKVDGTNKYIVKEIYNQPRKTLACTMQLKPSELLLLNALATNENDTLYLLTPRLWTIFAFINGKYFRPGYAYSIINGYDMYGGQIDNFKQRSHKRFHQLTFSYLKHLVKCGLIEYRFTDISKYENGYFCNLQQSDKALLENPELSKSITGIDSIKKTDKKDKFNKGFIIKAQKNLYEFILSEEEEMTLIKKANDNIMKYLEDNAKNRYNNYKSKEKEIKNMPIMEFPEDLSWAYLAGHHIYTNKYLKCQKILMDELIKIPFV